MIIPPAHYLFCIGKALLDFTGVEIAQTVSDACTFLLAFPLTIPALRRMGKDEGKKE